MTTEFDGLDFAAGSVKGVRSFVVDKYGRLRGPVRETVWLPGENESKCLASPEERVSHLYTTGQLTEHQARAFILGGTTYGGALFPTGANATLWHSIVGGSRRPAPTPVDNAERRAAAYGIDLPSHTFEDCACGFYGYYDGSDDYHREGRITGVVEGYGEVLIGTRGFRATKAKIVALRIEPDYDGVSSRTSRLVQRNYPGLPIFENFDTMVAVHVPDQGLEPSPDNDPDFWTRS